MAMSRLAVAQPSFAESFSADWQSLHAEAPFTIGAGQVHYLTTLAVGLDDDIVALLLLKKLKLARVVEPANLPATTVGMNSYVHYSFGGELGFGQLVHPSVDSAEYAMSVGSLLGAGLIGLEAGQTIEWPDSDFRLRTLHVLHVGNPAWAANAPAAVSRP